MVEKSADGNNIILDPNGPNPSYKLRQVENLTGTVVPSFGIVVEI